MGCWNATCGLSNLPIQQGDEILFFVLSNNFTEGELGGGFSYATDRYVPVGLPVHGQYNDYGGIENITKNGHRMFEFLTTDRRFKFVPNEGVTLVPEDAEELLNDMIERGESNYSLMMVRKDVLDGLKAQNVSNFPEYARQFATFTTAYAEEIERTKTEHGDEYMPLLHNTFAEMTLQKSLGYANMFANNLQSYEIPSLKQFIRLAHTSPHDDVPEGVIDVLYVTELLSALRKFWTPQSGAGSQDNSHDAHLALGKTVTAVCAKRDREIWGN